MSDLPDPQSARISESEARHLLATGIEDKIGALGRFSLSRRLFGLLVFVLLWSIGIAMTLAAMNIGHAWTRCTLWTGGTLCSAIAINALILHLHEGMHFTLFRSPFCNRWCSVLLGGTALISYTAYQIMHLRHHWYLGDPRDPDDYHHYTKRTPLVWAMHYGRLLVGAPLYIFLIPILAWRHGTDTDRRRIVGEYMVLAVIYVTVFFSIRPALLIYVWLVPLLIVGFMVNIRGFTQHGVTDAQDPFLASRSIQANPVVAFCLLHENFHLEHHLFPEVPSYHLAALHRLVWDRMPRVVTGTSYSGFLASFVRASFRMDDSPIGLQVRPEVGAKTAN